MSEPQEMPPLPTAEIIELYPKEVDIECSFCKTPKSKAKKMIMNAVTKKNICDKCIIKSMGILHPPKPDPDRILPVP